MENSGTQVERKSNSPAVSPVSRSTQADIDPRAVASKDNRIVRPLPLGALKHGRDSVEPRTPALSGSFAVTHKSKDPPQSTTDVSTELEYTSHGNAMPLPSLPSSRYSQMDLRRSSMVSDSTSALSKSIDGDVPRQTWKRRISCVSLA